MVVFKAEIGAATSRGLPGAGRLGQPGAVAARDSARPARRPWSGSSRRAIAPIVSLYVNDYNQAARRAYDRVGFREVGMFASVLF